MKKYNYSEDISKYPITSKLGDITNSLKNSPTRFLILTAETAAGKSTILPLELLEEFGNNGKILITEPRRLAVLGVANRLSDLLNEEAGESVGYKIHLNKRISNKTKLEVVTEAILVRQLQADSVLEDYNVVVLDEFHERSVNTDLALAFLKEAMELRDDLFVIIMSATIDTDKLRHYLGDKTPVISVQGRQFPVEVIYDNKLSVEEAIQKEVKRSLQEKAGDITKSCNILVFLPGIKEIRKVQENIPKLDAELCVLHSSISLEQQKKILKESSNLRVILSSAIAETSLTVPGVTCVIDSGLSRINRIDVNTGMERLSTETESQFSATQRMGRAGRLMPGRCIRLWSEANPRIKDMPCEILRADLTNLVLECADRGVYYPDKIQWLDSPNKASWDSCVLLLRQLGMLNADRRITEKGRDALKLGIHPRLAGIALGSFDNGKALIVKYSSYSKSGSDIQKSFLSDLERRINSIGKDKYKQSYNNDRGIIALEGFPDRLGKRVSEKAVIPAVYKLPSGREIILSSNIDGGEWIVAPDILIGENNTVAFDFEQPDTENVLEWLNCRTDIKEICSFENGKIKKTENICYGKIILSSKKVDTDSDDLAKAWINEVYNKGLGCLPLNEKVKSLLCRAEFLWDNNINIFTENNRFVESNNLKSYVEDNIEEWLPPFLGTSKVLTDSIVYDSLYWFLKGDKINNNAPEMIILSNGNKAKVKYERLASPDDKNKLVVRPVIEIIIQRISGCNKTPEICGVKVLLRLLSPASRPLQITDDLEGFWTGAWIDICKEMKGRYPKHNWDF